MAKKAREQQARAEQTALEDLAVRTRTVSSHDDVNVSQGPEVSNQLAESHSTEIIGSVVQENENVEVGTAHDDTPGADAC